MARRGRFYSPPVDTTPRVCRCDRPLSTDGECSKCGRVVLPFPVIELERDQLVVPPREYKTIRRPETLAA
jgi:hypothetical protein